MNQFKRREFRHCPQAWRGYEIPAEHSTMKESPMERTLGEMSMENEQRYNQIFAPAYNRYVRTVKKLGSDGAINMAAGLSTAGTMSDMAPKLAAGQRGALTAGVSPSSGASVMANTGARASMGSAMGNSAFGARMGQRGAYLSGLQNAVGIGKQQSSVAQQSMADVAGMAQSRAENSIQADRANASGLGSAAGGALGYFGIGPALNKQ